MNDAVKQILAKLPRSLGDQVAGYVASVDAAADSIFRDAKVSLTRALRDQLLVAAALRKTFGIVRSCYWAVDNSLAITRATAASGVRIGGATYSRQSDHFEKLRAIHKDLEQIAGELDLWSVLDADTYDEVVEELANGH